MFNKLFTILGWKKACAACKKQRWFVRKRAYWVDKISLTEPIVSEGELCNKCAKAIKKVTQSQ